MLAPHIFNALNRGIGLELVLVLPEGRRDLQLTNSLLRMSSAGAEIYWSAASGPLGVPYAVIDKSLLIYRHAPEDGQGKSDESLVLAFRADQKELIRQSLPFETRRESIDILFDADPDQAMAGTAITLRWNATGADTARIEPDIGEVPTQGTVEVSPLKDTLYTITAENAAVQTSRKQFVKVHSGPDVRILVSVHEPEVDAMIDLQSPAGFPGYYAIEAGQKVRIQWDCPSSGQMWCDQLGQLPLSGSHEMVVHQDMKMDFHFRQVFTRQSWPLRFVIVPDSTSEGSASEDEVLQEEQAAGKAHEWRGFWRLLIGKKKGSDE